MGAALGLGLVASTWTVRVAQTTFTDTRAEVGWETYSPERLAQLRAEGKPVFVDFTAAWCLTCQVNKKVALEKTEVMAKFKEKGVTRLLADWTRNDPTITKGLSELGRNGVPVYVLYPPKGEPRLLPEVLTPAMVVEALDKLP
jgi:thiol:disulfide interchange protein DsbD